MGSDRAPRRPGADPRPQLADRARWIGDGGGDLSAPRAGRGEGRDPDRSRRACLHRRGAASACAERRGDRVGAPRPGAGTMSSRPLYLKPRGASQLVPWEEIAVDAPEVGRETLLQDAQFVALDVETTGNAPFLVLEIGAERFRLDGTLSFFDTLVDCRAPINPYARERPAGAGPAKGTDPGPCAVGGGAAPRRHAGARGARRRARDGDGVSRPDRSSPGESWLEHGR